MFPLLPLRIPLECDLVSQLSNWIDSRHDNASALTEPLDDGGGVDDDNSDLLSLRPTLLPPTVAECRPDLVRLHDLRLEVGKRLLRNAESTTGSPSSASRDSDAILTEILPILEEYASILNAFCQKGGFPETERQGKGLLTLPWKNHTNDTTSSIVMNGSSLTWERANTYWNLAAMSALQAKNMHPVQTKPEWKESLSHLQTAASWIQHMRVHLYGDGSNNNNNGDDNKDNSKKEVEGGLTDWLSPDVLKVIESFFAAAAQRAGYAWLRADPRPKHYMLAKLAAAAIPLYSSAAEDAQRAIASLQQQQTQLQSASVAVAVTECRALARAWGMWMSAVSEYHKALDHEAKRVSAHAAAASTSSTQHRRQQLLQEEEHLTVELARLDVACRFGILCDEFLRDSIPRQEEQSSSSSFLVADLFQVVQAVLPQMKMGKFEAQQEQQKFTAEHNRALIIPSHEELPEIPPQLVVKINSAPAAMAKLLPPLPTDLFKMTLDETARKILAQTRLEWEEEWLPALEQAAEELTEQGRQTLASVNLPHSLTAYRQERAGGGIPQDLWLRVERLQKENGITKLQQELWDLKDVADQASVLYKGILSQLQEDLTMDELFREQNPTFEGHDVSEIQKTFRLTLENYAHLMESAKNGDALLFRRLESLNTDPKYRLLQFRKSQLDRLIPPANNSNNTTQQDINVEELSQYLVDLSSLFQQRDDLLDSLKNQIRRTHAGLVDLMIQAMQQSQQQQQQQPPAEDVYEKIVASARDSLEQDMVQGLQTNMNAQSDLLKRILDENEYFCRARGGSSAAAAAMPSENPAGDRSILKIEDALEEIDQLDKHLKEGRAFYNVVIPKLEKLQQQVGDVSARLTVDRCDFDDKARRKQQEAEDARMAASMSSNNASNNNNNNSSRISNGGSPQSHTSDQSNRSHRGDQGDTAMTGSGEPTAAVGYSSNEEPHQQQQQQRIRSPNPHHETISRRESASEASAGSSGTPGVESVSHSDQPVVRVDDEKVANLVAMDFDPDKVVAALTKYDNNVEQAINDLLSG